MGLIRPFKPSGKTVSFFSVVNPLVGEAPLSITHQGGQRSVTVLSKTDNRTVDEIDPQESYNVLNTYPEKGAELVKLMEEWEKTTTANPRGFRK